MKLLVVGGTSGFGQELCESFGNGSLGIGRSKGYDIGRAEDRKRIVELSKDFDIVLNHAHNGHIEGQIRLLLDLFEAWKNAAKTGSIFTTGSIATYRNMKFYQRYAVIKFLHDQVSNTLAERIVNEKLTFRLTNLRPGMLSKSGRDIPSLSGHQVAPLLKFLHSYTLEVPVPDLVLTSCYG